MYSINPGFYLNQPFRAVISVPKSAKEESKEKRQKRLTTAKLGPLLWLAQSEALLSLSSS